MSYRIWMIWLLFGVSTAIPAGAQPQQVRSDEEQMEFLQHANIVHGRPLKDGITNSRRLTLDDGVGRHDAHFQTVDVRDGVKRSTRGVELNFRDSFRFNIAAYRLARLLGIRNIPVSVPRRFNGEAGAVTWWVDDVRMTGAERWKNRIPPPDQEDWTRQIQTMRVFDELIANTDRNLGNVLITTDWRLWMVDHTRAFRRYRYLQKPKLLARCDRALLAALRDTDEQALSRALEPWIDRPELRALLVRRTLLLEHFDQRIAEKGEAEVLYGQQISSQATASLSRNSALLLPATGEAAASGTGPR
jgi:hypothetical protein